MGFVNPNPWFCQFFFPQKEMYLQVCDWLLKDKQTNQQVPNKL